MHWKKLLNWRWI